MKTYLKTAIAMSVLAIGLAACSSNTTKEPEKNIDSTAVVPNPPEPTSIAFTVRYGLPLTAGRDNGENEIVNAERAKAANVGELRPAIAELVKQAKAGTIPSYPKADGVASGDPKTFLKTALSDLGKRLKVTPKDDDLLVSTEVTFDGVATEGHSKLTPKSLSLIWVDPKGNSPDFEVAHILLSEVGELTVKQGSTLFGLSDYLAEGVYEHYPIEIISPKGSEKISAFTDCKAMQEKIDKGTF